MNSVIDLDNNYQLKIINSYSDFPDNVTNIDNLKISTIFRQKILLLKIDFNTLKIENFKNVLRKFLSIKNIILKKHIPLGIRNENTTIIGYIINYDENNEKQNDFILGINAILFDTKYERYNYIYDTVCNYLDSYFYGKNLCDFKNNKCGEKRTTSSVTGCCRHFKIKWLGPFSKLVECEYLNMDNHTCSVKCISCKLFTCDYLRKKGIQFKIKDILLLDTFFNPLQKYFIKYTTFTPKEKILKRLIMF